MRSTTCQPCPPHKVYIFVNCFKPEDEHLRAIEKLKGGGRTLLWFYAPGFLSENGTDTPAMERLTAIRLAYRDEAAPLRALLDGDDVLLEGMPGGAAYGTDVAIRPAFYADDPGVVVLGRYADGRAGLQSRGSGPGLPSILRLRPCLPGYSGASLARQASTCTSRASDVIYANRSLLGISVNEGGERLFRLPARCDVYDLFEQRWSARGVRELRLEIGPVQHKAAAAATGVAGSRG